MNKLIIGLIIGLLVGGAIGYFLYGMINPRGPGSMKESNFQNNNFEIGEEIEQEIISFFESNPLSSEIESYCGENTMYCIYYCREINSEYEICDNIGGPTNMGR